MTAIPSKTTSLKETVIITIVAILLYGIVAGIRGLTNVFIPEIAAATGLSYGTVSSVFAIRSIVYALSIFVSGLLTQKIPIRYLMAFGAALVTIGMVGTAFATQYLPLLIFMGIFVGLGAGLLCYAIVFSAAIPLLGKKEAAISAGIVCSSQGIFCIILTPIIQTVGSTAVGLTISILVIGAVTACLVPLSIFFFRKRRDVEAEQKMLEGKTTRLIAKPIKYMVKRPYFYLLALATTTYGLCDAGMINHLYEKALVMFDSTSEFATYLVMIYAMALIIGPILGGFVSARMKNARMLLVILFALWLGIATSIYYLPMNEVTEIIVVAGLGIASSMLVPVFCLLVRERSPVLLFSSIYPIITNFECFTYAFDAYFGGWSYDQFGNFDLSMLITYIMCGIVIVVFTISILKDRNTRKEKVSP